ncbi:MULTISPECIES: homoserine kinase [unclassified Hydrogenobaculum]|jgi:homoserine kinase|uniref:homoserine kinase n=1 Tax=unclassified Hydrogenobaculum TaxID=2622382 RepID=UPI0001C5136D|nr:MULTISPECIES: homoserine kinase [unclassified Hydrogenobaculum]AEF18986.1 homoserine kinase [Hydrogenobaculum sp. 3684]AEG46273.1 Homoserine kinase [Hydrogenobaculum sp. SHO]AGG14918.1 homoserine kinase [Hydrogenobaculum sp. HO]AGH93214.1 homoserine kinase [Hydrogenobaculum sp. SN]
MEFILKVPASMSNLGAGFDTFGLAVNLYNVFHVKSSRTFSISFIDLDIKPEENLFLKVYKRCIEIFNEEEMPVSITIKTEIPFSRGLGSSSSAIIGAIKTFSLLYEKELSYRDIFKIAYEFEPHPDNLVPALVGGFNVCLKDEEQTFFNTIDFPEELKIIAIIPDIKISTEEARKILPAKIDIKDAIYNIQRSNLLLSSLVLKRFELLKEAVKDKLHQPYRKSLIPFYDNIEKIAYDRGAKAVFISGSGSTIGIFALENEEIIGKTCVEFLKSKGVDGTYKILSVDKEGARVC